MTTLPPWTMHAISTCAVSVSSATLDEEAVRQDELRHEKSGIHGVLGGQEDTLSFAIFLKYCDFYSIYKNNTIF
jgi:hypothetical protein